MVHVHVSAVADPGAKVEECTPYTVARSYVSVQYLPNRGMRGAIDPVVAVSLNEQYKCPTHVLMNLSSTVIMWGSHRGMGPSVMSYMYPPPTPHDLK